MTAIQSFGDFVVVFPGTPLCGHPDVAKVVAEMFDAAQGAGFIPKDRSPLDDDSAFMWAADNKSGAIIGAAVFFDAGMDRVWLDFIYVNANRRHQGIARTVLGGLLQLGTVGAKKVMFGTHLDNVAMRQFARAEGFRETSITYEARLSADGGVVQGGLRS